MEPKKKIPLSLNNYIPRNLFRKTYTFSENRKFSSKEKEKEKKIEEPKSFHKTMKSFIYLRKTPTMIENKKEQDIENHLKICIDSKTEARLPQGLIDLTYDNPVNE